MDAIGQLFAGGVVLICAMAFISFYFPPKESGNDSITIAGRGTGVNVVDKMVNKND